MSLPQPSGSQAQPSSMLGNLLVASTLVHDPVFSKAVCLIVHEDDNGYIGVMLNRPIQPNPDALMQMIQQGSDATDQESPSQGGTSNRLDDEDFFENEFDPDYEHEESGLVDPSAEKTLADATESLGIVHFGGPMNGPVVAVHPLSEFAEAETATGIFVAAQKPNLEALVKQNAAPYRMIVGHLGWEANQLHAEIAAGFWHIIPATTDAVFAHDMEMWPGVIRRATANSMARWIGTPDVPMAYELN